MTGYMVVCPYCGEKISKNSKTTHLEDRHPDKPRPSDKDFPGWKTE